ncbi:phage antirepressor KilAC domain-containing protein [Psychrobacter sp. FME13]|uniref:Rha family transcriptional regulator n=1 Tax=Psychrobacter sp. FME13 TaxID=2487708 RepID=UPI0017885B9A|nr:phage antirepressor KilAC domain-containing protein [Psychrobacter sp. FME13]MBE0440580.1 phage antirepressor KilAC domain-containing protein [Psychrobacter sp. FME13]
MNNIMQVTDISKTMSSREIAALTKKDHSHVIRDIRSMLSQIDDPSMDDADFKEVFDSRGYTSEISLNKDLTLTLVAGYNSRFRYTVIKRWQELEAQASQPVMPALPNFTNPADAAIAWAEEYKAKEAAQAQVTELKPKAAALDTLSHAKGSLGIRETANTVGIPERKFIARCTDENKPVSSRFMYRDDKGKLRAYSHRIKQGFMTQKITSYAGKNGKNLVTVQVKFTAAGVAKIAEMLEKERNKELEAV